MQEQDMKSLLEAEEESMQEVREHDVVKATVVAVDDGQAYVNIAGLKADVPISKRELASPEGFREGCCESRRRDRGLRREPRRREWCDGFQGSC